MRRFCIPLVVALAAVSLAKDEAPKDFDYGPYFHFLKSKETAKLRARTVKLVQGLRGLFYQCPTCRGRGKILVVVREEYYDRELERRVPEVREMQSCPKCDGERMLFKEALAERFIRRGFYADDFRHREWRSVHDRWLRRLESTRVGFRKTPRIRYDVSGRYATVRSGRSALWPLEFRLQRFAGKHEWFLHDADLHGSLGQGDARVAGTAKVERVFAGDVLQLEDGMIVRIAGITIPTPDNKIQKNPVSRPDESARATVRGMLEGKEVKLVPDKHASLTLDGQAIAFVELDSRDVGEELGTV